MVGSHKGIWHMFTYGKKRPENMKERTGENIRSELDALQGPRN